MSFSGQLACEKNSSRIGPARAIAVSTPPGPPRAAHVAKDDALRALETLGTVCRFRRNETIFAEGDELRSSYRIVSGAVRLSRIAHDGRRQIAEFRAAGEFIGFEWEGHCALTAEAVRDVVAVRFARARVDRLIEQRAEVRDGVVALIREELRSLHEHLITLGCQSAKERVAAFLLQLARRARAEEGEVIEIELGRQDIADYLGLTLETISRTLSEFQRIGVISLPKRRQIVIRSKSRLRAQTLSVN